MASKRKAGRIARRATRRAFRILRRARMSRRVAKAGANNVGKAVYKASKRKRMRRFGRRRRGRY